jgi:hypothetical protein
MAQPQPASTQNLFEAVTDILKLVRDIKGGKNGTSNLITSESIRAALREGNSEVADCFFAVIEAAMQSAMNQVAQAFSSLDSTIISEVLRITEEESGSKVISIDEAQNRAQKVKIGILNMFKQNMEKTTLPDDFTMDRYIGRRSAENKHKQMSRLAK